MPYKLRSRKGKSRERDIYREKNYRDERERVKNF